MSKIVQWKRGNTALNSTYVGSQGEITVDTDDYSLYVHDGVTVGGYKISNNNDMYSNVNAAAFLSSYTGTVSAANIQFTTGAVITETAGQAIAFGDSAGSFNQGNGAVSLGSGAGADSQGALAIAIGTGAGQVGQQVNSIAIGYLAGYENQGSYSIAIGHRAGVLDQPPNSIILDASPSTLNAVNSGFFVNPISSNNISVANSLFYNSTTKEITQSNALSISSNEIFAGNILPKANIEYSLGSETNQWKDLWVSNNTIYIDSIPITITANGTLTVNGAPISANVDTGSIRFNNYIIYSFDNSDIWIDPSNDNGSTGWISVPGPANANTQPLVIENQLAGNVEIRSNNKIWIFDNVGNIALPGGSKLVPDGPNIDLIAGNNGWAELQSFNANNYMWVDNTGAYIGTDWTGAARLWTFDTNGTIISSPALTGNVGDGYSTQKSITGSSEKVYGDPFAVWTNGSQILVWSSSATDILAAKMTLRMQRNANTVEMAEIMMAKRADNANVVYSVSNRICTDDAANLSAITVSLDASNRIALYVTPGDSQDTYFTYSVTEFGQTYD